MPDPRPLRLWLGTHDYPPSSETSNPRTRRAQLRRALQDTSELAQETGGMADTERRPRTSLLSPINRRRQRSPSPDSGADGSSREATTAREGRGQRNKRRRLNVDAAPAPAPPPIKYGHFGQVEPGRLKLEIISCDGGEHVDPRHPGLYLGVKNILQHDKSVYCSVRRGCNIILKHADDTPFCLEKLHIVGPEHGFTAPVRGGLVYIAMTLQDLQKYIDPSPPAHGAGIDTLSPSRHRQNEYVPDGHLRESPERLTLSDALRDEQVNYGLSDRVAHTPLGQHLIRQREEAERTAADSYRPTEEEANYYGADFGFSSTDPEAHCEIPGLPSSDDLPGSVADSEGERVPVTVVSDEDVGPEEISSQEVLDFRLQRLRLQGRRVYTRSPGLYGDSEEDGPLTSRVARRFNGLRFDANREEELQLARVRERQARRDAAERAADNERRFAESVARFQASRRAEVAGGGRWSEILGGREGSLGPVRGPRTVSPEPRVPAFDNDARAARPGLSSGSEDAALHSEDTIHANINTNTTHTTDADDGVTRARFRIKEGKHKVTLKFSPAVSGRFVMLSLWGDGADDAAGLFGVGGRDGVLLGERGGGLEGGNVDVQSVVLKGYGGGRFFPSRVGV
ncbi:hypothetical protein B0A55_04056 [Friedmanniomyces simplex]|uniref:Uncharacterized protein n=1 Tax=Friedmanniomyces simplex TaxID=329884 RepID=A0A4V6WL65_9PEZI|nr:hypothetical protein B0A55_04056 [Friedmanniomyces simplex]